MAYPNKLLRNAKTGQDIRFIKTAQDTAGRLLEMETTYHAASKEPPPHYHPYQEEEFTVLEGELSVRVNGHVQVLRAGDRLHLSKHTVHSMWNGSSQKTVVRWVVQPALHTEYFLETATGLVAGGKTSKAGLPPLLQAALLARRFQNEFRLAKPPFIVQKFLFALLAPFAYLRGYKADYPEYLD